MADDSTTGTTTTTPTPVQSPDVQSALVAFFGSVTAHEGVETATLQAALDQHTKDQATITSDQATIDADTQTIQGDATAKTAEDAELAAAQANEVSPAIISSIDAATNALNSGQPLPAFPGAPTPDPIPVPAVIGS